MALVFTLIGDLIGSRRVASRAAVQDALAAALADTARLVPPIDRLEATVGDEFQGVFGTLGDATLAALVVRLHLGGTVDTRCGIGLGEREVFRDDRTPMLQDGPAWWSARAAIDALGAPANRLRRTWFDPGDAAPDAPAAGLVNAYLATRDALVDRMNPRARTVLLMAIAGRTQREIALAEDVSASAISQVMARGVGAVRDAQAMLSELDPGIARSAP